MPRSSESRRDRLDFATTLWTVVLAAGDGRDSTAKEALELLCGRYWFPIYARVRRHGHGPEDAEDLTQGFFLHVCEKRHHLASLTREKGKFRSLLLAWLKNFLVNQNAKSTTAKRGGDIRCLSFDAANAEQWYLSEPDAHLTPDRMFDRHWALMVLDRALDRLRRQYVAAGKNRQFDRLKGYLSDPAGSEGYSGVADELGISPSNVAVTVHRFRRRYRELVREEIKETVTNVLDGEEEIRSLLAALS